MWRTRQRRLVAGSDRSRVLFHPGILGAGILSAGLLALGAGAQKYAREISLPAGITLPVQLGHTLKAGKTTVGTAVLVKITQRVPLSEHSYLEKGTIVRGEVVASAAGDGSVARPATLALRFTTLHDGNNALPLQVKAVAIANFVEVSDTQAPILNSVSGGNSSPANWATRQVGGDEVFRQLWKGGLYDNAMRLVGSADYYGVYSLPLPLEGGGAPLPRALGVFSAGAAGLYGFGDACSLQSGGGVITLQCLGKHAVLRDGDDLLLAVLTSR